MKTLLVFTFKAMLTKTTIAVFFFVSNPVLRRLREIFEFHETLCSPGRFCWRRLFCFVDSSECVLNLLGLKTLVSMDFLHLINDFPFVSMRFWVRFGRFSAPNASWCFAFFGSCTQWKACIINHGNHCLGVLENAFSTEI